LQCILFHCKVQVLAGKEKSDLESADTRRIRTAVKQCLETDVSQLKKNHYAQLRPFQCHRNATQRIPDKCSTERGTRMWRISQRCRKESRSILELQSELVKNKINYIEKRTQKHCYIMCCKRRPLSAMHAFTLILMFYATRWTVSAVTLEVHNWLHILMF
jgi:hypothetical protein